MDVRQLRYFVAVAETRHFGRAAERLHMAQSPLSQAIRQLETQVGATLFDRTTRRVDLTEAGEALRAEAVRILASVAAAHDRVARVAAGDLGHLRIGSTGLANYRHVPGLVARLTAELPGVALRLTSEMLTPALETALTDHRIDLAVLRAPARDPRHGRRSDQGSTPIGELDPTIEAHVLARECLVLAVPAPYAPGPDDGVRLADHAGERFVRYSAPGSVVAGAADRACRAAGFTPRRTMEADQTSTVLALVAAGAGVALLPESVLALRVEGVRYLTVTDPPAEDLATDVALAWRRDDTSPALVRALAVLRRPGLVPAAPTAAPAAPAPAAPDRSDAPDRPRSRT